MKGRTSERRVDPWVERLEWLMDRAVPVGPWSFGLDPLLDPIPGIGDALSTLVSLAMVVRAIQIGLPRSAVARMMVNIAIDTIVGAIPVAGNIFDFVWKSNTKNLAIYRSALAEQRRAAADWTFVLVVLAAALAMVAAPVVLLGWIIYEILGR